MALASLRIVPSALLSLIFLAIVAVSCTTSGREACKAAGGKCVLGGYQGCAERGSFDCNPKRNPGGAFCCLKFAKEPARQPAPTGAAGGSRTGTGDASDARDE